MTDVLGIDAGVYVSAASGRRHAPKGITTYSQLFGRGAILYDTGIFYMIQEF
jgi:hypothetical protein